MAFVNNNKRSIGDTFDTCQYYVYMIEAFYTKVLELPHTYMRLLCSL